MQVDVAFEAVIERLRGIAPLVDAIYERQEGDSSERAGLYPADLTAEEFTAACTGSPHLAAPDCLATRSGGKLCAVPYHQAYEPELAAVASLLREAAALCPAPRFARYLSLLAEAVVSGDYRESDTAWITADDAPIDLIVGPMETYLDRFQGLKTSYESCLLRRDMELSEQLGVLAGAREAVAEGHPDLQQGIRPADPVFVVGEALSLGGEFKAIKVRGCSLPNDPWVREHVGVKLTIFEDVIGRQGRGTIIPLLEAVLGPVPPARHEAIVRGYLVYVLMHELGHNLGVYPDAAERLGPAQMPLEEAKASLVGVLATREALRMGLIEEGAAAGLAPAMLGTCLMNIRVAETIPSREHYRVSDTLILAGAMAGGGLARQAATWRLDAPALPAALNEALAGVARLLRHGTAADAAGALGELDAEGGVGELVEATRGIPV